MEGNNIRPTKVNKVIYFTITLGIVVLSILIILAVIYNNNDNGGIWLKFVDGKTVWFVAFVSTLAIILTAILVKMLTNPKTSVLRKSKPTDSFLNVKGFTFQELDNKKVNIKPEDDTLIKTLQSLKHLENSNVVEKYTKNNKIEDIPVVNTESDEEEIIPSKDGASRFYMLTQIDKDAENYEAPLYDNEITLKEVCEQFRNFACNKLRLYYDIVDIRRFIAGLSVTKLIILQGMSGTGKTSLAYAFGEFLTNKAVVVPIQPMWKERTDMIGYYNEFTKKFNETTLLYKMYEANTNKNIYITVLDEMNIARVEYYFAEFLSLLELPNPEGRNLDVVSDVWDNDPKLLNKGKLRLPINMWFIGTANNDDSTFAISDKVYDRAMVLNLDKKADVFDAPETNTLALSSDHLADLFVKAQKEYSISERNMRRIQQIDNYLIDTFHITFGNRIMKQIKAYVPVVVACGGTELEAIDDILSRKVLRKLESKNPVYVRAQSDALCNFLDDLFGTDKMSLCKEVIHNIEQNA